MKQALPQKQEHHFYMWIHPYTKMTCYGITSNLENRQRTYQGGNGFPIVWTYLVEGSDIEIRRLEKTLKNTLIEVGEHLGKSVTYGEYEWITADVEYSSVVKLVESFIETHGYKTLKIVLKKDEKVLTSDTVAV